MEIDLNKLEQLAAATRDGMAQLSWRDRDGWYDATDVAIDMGCGAAEPMPECDRDFVAAANPAVVLELVRRLKAARGTTRDEISHRAALLMHDAKVAGLQVTIDGEAAVVRAAQGGSHG
jgi:hypothetical protein